MNLSETIFNKDLYDLDYNDLENYFLAKKDETINLEFKSYVDQGEYSKKEYAIKKSVCGMLNSEGGIIVWGAPVEVKDGKGNTSAQGGLTPFDTKLDKDRLVNILSSSITPLPVGIRVHEVQNQSGLSVFIIECQKSIDKPHQFDNLYFIRLDGQTRIAPHYVISALMKSVDFPTLRGHIRLRKIETDGHNYVLTFNRLLYNASPYINEINARMRIVVLPGHIYVHGKFEGGSLLDDYPLLSNGAPFLTPLTIKIPSSSIHNDLDILFQFGGEKSPSKISRYKYKFSGSITLGDVLNEDIYLIEKFENTFPSDVTSNSVDDNIDTLLNQ
jgi:hypothetical protein